MWNLLRNALFKIYPDAELGHERMLGVSSGLQRFAPERLLSAATPRSDPCLARTVCGLRFPSPIGLAAGFDKNAVALKIWQALGFGFIEAGTVTLRPQAGNVRPRLFRIPESRAIINSLGFPGLGVEVVMQNIQKAGKLRVPLGINIGKNAVTNNEDAAAEYVCLFEYVYPFADYIAVNISSPNTKGLRLLLGYDFASEIFHEISQSRRRLLECGKSYKPIFVKISPDLMHAELGDVLRVVEDCGIDGIVVANTTINRTGLQPTHWKHAKGGLSGAPLYHRTLEMVHRVHLDLPSLPIIASGGIETSQQVAEVLKAGASLIQIYTALIYEGPGLPRKILSELALLL